MINVIYVGSYGFPYGLATIQRQILIAKGLIYANASCRVITRFGTESDATIERKGVYENLIPYECAAPKPYRPSGFLSRNINRLLGTINEALLIAKYRKKGEVNVLLGIRSSFQKTLYYRLLSFLLGYKYIIDVNELLGIEDDKKGKGSLNHKLFNNYSQSFCDGMILISDYLIDYYLGKKATLNYVKVPIICDVDLIDNVEIITDEKNYFLYCSSVSYLESIIFVIDAFCRLTGNSRLKLIVSGQKTGIDKVYEYVAECSKSNSISIESGIPYNKLISYYKEAKGLLIPLPETIQHMARFPHKIGEYSSSKSAIISNKWGEVKNYFDDSSAYLAERYDLDGFVEQMTKCDESNSTEIADNAYKIAVNVFDYKQVSKSIIDLINRIS